MPRNYLSQALSFEDAQRFAASVREAFGSEGLASVDQDVIARLVVKLFELGITEPQKLTDAAFLLSTSKLFTSMVS